MRKILFFSLIVSNLLFSSLTLSQPLTSTAEVDVIFATQSIPSMSITPRIVRSGDGNILNIHNNLSQPITLQQNDCITAPLCTTTISNVFNIDYDDDTNPNLNDSVLLGFYGTYVDEGGNHVPFSFLAPTQITNGQWSTPYFSQEDDEVFCQISAFTKATNHFAIAISCATYKSLH